MTCGERDGSACAVSVIISTYNRSADLTRALASLLHQEGDVRYEVLVVDNNSTDDTRQVVERAMATSKVPLRYLFEPRQGVSFGRNTGIENASAPIVAFTDDDCCPAANWVTSIVRAFERHPDLDCIGGRVLPRWPEKVPEWFTWRQVSPLAFCEHGEQEFVVDAGHAATCLITANLACRRSVFERSGLFSPEYPRGQDREIQLRMWRAGCHGLYAPDVLVTVDVPASRLTKQHFRQWFRRYGSVHARMRLLETIDRDGRLIEPRTRGTLLGVPPFLCRRLAEAVVAWMVAVARFRPLDTFFHENRVRYLAHYIRTRVQKDRQTRKASMAGELARFLRDRFGARAD